MLVNRQKTHGHAIGAGLRQLHPQFAALAGKKHVRNLNQNARAVARLRIASRRAAMGEVDEHLKTLADNFVALFAANAGDQPHTAGIVLIPRVIETLGLGSAETTIRCIHGNLLNEFFPCRMRSCDGKTPPRRDSCWKEIALVFHKRGPTWRASRVGTMLTL